jgi:transcriptional regulator with PAS, ATPase and Fis domain
MPDSAAAESPSDPGRFFAILPIGVAVRDGASREPSPAASAEPVFRSRAMAVVMRLVERVSAAPRITVLVDGESGVGKEVVARAIHQRSAPRQSFVALNCAALPEGLLEAELFGHEPGAFTGACPKGRPGLLEAAGAGTLLLDEIGELPLALQARLLRVLQERSFRRLGSHVDQPLQARVVACTNRDLEAEVGRGAFREDLYYRLNVMRIRVPALRERREDIEPLIEHFCLRVCSETGLPAPAFGEQDLQRLREAPWRGNVRELSNAIERAVLMGPQAALQTSAGPPPATDAPPTADTLATLGDDALSLEAMERTLIRHVLGRTAGNRARAARVLGVDRTTLYSKLRRYQIA